VRIGDGFATLRAMMKLRGSLATLWRGSLLVGVAVAALSSAALAQSSAEAIDALFVELTRLQDSNIAVARQMSDIQRRAATALQTVLADGKVTDPAQQEVIEVLVANALTMASVVLSPVATQEVAAGDAFSGLLAENMKLVARAEPLFGAEPELAQAIEQYEIMQLQSRDLAVALQNGWNRYGQAIAAAEGSSLLPPGSFDPNARSWTISVPDVELAEVASPAAGGSDDRLAPDDSALALAEPVTTGAVADAVEQINEATAAAAADTEIETAAVATEPDRLPETSAPALPDPPITAQPAGWMVMIGDNARAVAVASNSNAATADRIRGMQIGCHPNGTLRYIFETDGNIGEYLIFANQTDSAKIPAESNMISGGAAIHMSDVLRLAFEWASANPSPDSTLMIAPADAPDAVATFPVAGYLEARGRVLDGCVPWEDKSAAAVEEVPAIGPAEVDGGTPLELTIEESSPDRVENVAPVPRPRPASRMPVDLMTAG
jgi:hypothetical protein